MIDRLTGIVQGRGIRKYHFVGCKVPEKSFEIYARRSIS
jgi:hypothetical protein